MLKNLSPGQRINDKFGVISITKKATSKGDPYLIVELSHTSGLISGKVWADALPFVDLKEGTVADLEVTVDQYRGVNNFNISKAKTLADEKLENYLSEVPTLVFDIETVGVRFEELDETDKNYLFNNLEKNFEGSDEERKNRTGLYPLFAFVVAIGMYNPNSKRGYVYYLDNEKIKNEKKKNAVPVTHFSDDKFEGKAFEKESDLLESFWETAQKYERFVTYNGSGFDWPFLNFRSGINRVKVPFEAKGDTDKFLDLASKLRMNFRSFKLEQVCKAFGISNPKQKGVSGMEVAKLYREGKLVEILDYVGRDVVATAELYQIWKTFLAGKVVM